MYDSWRSAKPAAAVSLPTGHHPQLISSAWRIRNLSDSQAIVLGPEVAVAQDSSKNERQGCDKMAPVLNEELGRTEIAEQGYEKVVKSSFPLQSPSLSQPCAQNPNDFAYSIGSMASPVVSQVVDSISDLQKADETEALDQRLPDGALPVATGSCGISYANGHVTGSEFSVSDEKTGYMNLRHKLRR